MRYDFASDNTSGMCPEAMAAMAEANAGRVSSYGEDHWTTLASDRIRELFETPCEVFFVFNGTAANALALASMCQSYHSIICHEQSHAERDECGAPEFFSNGTKLLLADGPDGKLMPGEVASIVARRRDLHFPKPRVISVTQATELGTVYRPEELAELSDVARHYDLTIHMDGARFANAVATLGLPPKALTWEAGVDVLCFGGTKNGMAIGDAVIFFRRELAREFEYRCKQAGQLCSKMRFLAAPWTRMLEDDTWLRHGAHANAMARHLAACLTVLPGVELLHPVEANGVFVEMPAELFNQLRERGWVFYNFIGDRGYRLMCSWETTREVIDEFVADARHCASGGPEI